MKPKKQKRIRAEKLWSCIPPPRAVARWQSLVTWSGMRPKRLADQKPYYVIAAEDVLIEQLANDICAEYMKADRSIKECLTYALKRAGITTPKGGAK